MHILFLLPLLYLVLLSVYSSTARYPQLLVPTLDSAALNLPLLHYNNRSLADLFSIYDIESASLLLNSLELKPFKLVNLAYSTLQTYFVSSSDIIIASSTQESYNNLIIIFILTLTATYFKYYQSFKVIKF